VTFTATDVESLSTALSRWEIGEYVFATLVTVACAGEYVAEFTDWLTDGIEERKKRLSKRSTLLLVASLALELLCLVRTNSLSGQLIGSLSDKARSADTKAQSALDKSGIAENRANDAGIKASKAQEKSEDALAKAGKAEKSLGKVESEASKARAAALNALALARSARQEADSFEKDIVSAKRAAAEAEAKLADRTLSDEQLRRIANKLVKFASQEYIVTAYWDSKESLGIANRIHAALQMARWSYSDEGSKSMMLGGVVGVVVWTHPNADETAKRAAKSLIDALNAEGIEAAPREQNPKNPKSNTIAVNVGSKR
jgi:hypothetical protein